MSEYIEQLKESIARKEKVILDKLSNEMKNDLDVSKIDFKNPEDKFTLFQKVSDCVDVFHKRLLEALTEDERTYKVWGIPKSMLADIKDVGIGDAEVHEVDRKDDK